jgi:serine protease inhibitor
MTAVWAVNSIVLKPPKPFEMIMDRPFLFVIGDDETKSILFMGIVSNPTANAGS